MNNIIDWIQRVSLDRYKHKEESDYEQLLFYYNKIDINRIEMDDVKKHIVTLEQRELSQEEKKEIREGNYNSSKNVMISLIVFNIIIVLLKIFCF